MAQTYSPVYGLGQVYIDGETFYSAAEIMRLHDVVEGQLAAVTWALGFGVKQGFEQELLVTAGSGLNVTVAKGLAVVGTLTKPCVIRTTATSTFAAAANHGSGDPLYLHVGFFAGGSGADDSFESRLPSFQFSSLASIDGWIMLATITTNGSSVTNITPNPNRFIQTGDGGTGIPDGGTTGQTLVKQSSTDGDAVWADTAPLISTKYHYSGNSVDTLTGPAGTATLTPGDGAVAIKNRIVTATGADPAKVIISNLTSTAAGTGGNWATGGTASATIDNSHAGQAFDGNSATKWQNGSPSGSLPQSITYTRATPLPITNYSVSGTSGTAGTPTAWTLQASTDGTTFVTIDTRSGQNGGGGLGSPITAGPFTISDTTAYLAIRLTVTATIVDSTPIISELTVNGAGAPGILEFDVEITDGVNYPLSVSAGDIERTQDGNQGGVAMSYESGVELRARVDELALNTVANDWLSDVSAYGGPAPIEGNQNIGFNTTSGAITQPVPAAADFIGKSLIFTRVQGTAAVTVTFESGEGTTIVLPDIGDTVRMQSYVNTSGGAVWVIQELRIGVANNPPQRTVTANTTMTQADGRVVLDASSSRTITLPDCMASFNRRFVLMNAGSADMVAACAGSDTFIGGATSVTVPSGQSLEVLGIKRANGTYAYMRS